MLRRLRCAEAPHQRLQFFAMTTLGEAVGRWLLVRHYSLPFFVAAVAAKTSNTQTMYEKAGTLPS